MRRGAWDAVVRREDADWPAQPHSRAQRVRVHARSFAALTPPAASNTGQQHQHHIITTTINTISSSSAKRISGALSATRVGSLLHLRFVVGGARSAAICVGSLHSLLAHLGLDHVLSATHVGSLRLIIIVALSAVLCRQLLVGSSSALFRLGLSSHFHAFHH